MTLEDVDGISFLHTFVMFVFIFISVLNLNFASFKLLKHLVDGDIESNPGPTPMLNFLKVVQGSFHQGDPKFGYTAGVQCACIFIYMHIVLQSYVDHTVTRLITDQHIANKELNSLFAIC